MTVPRDLTVRTVLLVLAGLLAASMLAACGSSGRGASATGPTLAQVRALLARHGQAVRVHSPSAFLADVDGSAAAAGFRRRQSALITNIAHVPLATWSYSVNSVVTQPAVAAAQRARFGAPVLVVHVTVTDALRYVDPHPSSHDLWWTFVTRHGKVYLAGDDALVNQGGVSWVGPWDFGPVVVVRGTASLVLGHPANAAQLPALARAVDAAVPVVTGVWGPDWARQVAVIVPGSSAELTALTGSGGSLADISAETVNDSVDPTTGTPLGQRVIMNPAVLSTLTPTGRRIVIQHEITHVASAASTTAASPRWLIEGFAEYVGNLGSGQSVRVAASELARQVARGSVPATLPADAVFTAGGAGLPPAYEESWLACRLIAARAGPAGLVRFYRLVGASAAAPDAAVAAALHTLLHEQPATFLAQWRSYVQRELG